MPLPISICVVDTGSGEEHYLTTLPMSIVQQVGLISQAIVGKLSRPLQKDEAITPDLFIENRQFRQFLQDVIRRNSPWLPACQAEAKRLGTGIVCILDLRTRQPDGSIPPRDIFGIFNAKDGMIEPDSYTECNSHQLLSEDGFFRLSPDLQSCLMRELKALVQHHQLG